jgi:predicted acetyltransferase
MRTFRTAEPDDVDRLVSLLIRSFPRPERQEADVRRWLEENAWGTWSDLWLGQEDGGPAATMAWMYPFAIRAWEADWPTAGIGAVAVAADQRRRAWARDLLRHLQIEALAAQRPLAALYPFRVDFYRTMGYGVAELREEHRFAAAELPRSEEARRVRVGTVAELDMLLGVYQRFRRHRNGLLDRDGAAWMKILLFRGLPFVAIHEGAAGAEGYLFYRLVQDRPLLTTQRLQVEELVWTTDAAWRGLWGFVRDLEDQVDSVSYMPREPDGIGAYLRNPIPADAPTFGRIYGRTAERGPGLMVKILDPIRVARGRAYGSGAGSLQLRLTDPLDGREIAFGLRVADGQGTTGPPADTGEQLRTDLATWTELQCGTVTVAQAIRNGAAEGRLDAERWDHILVRGSFGAFEHF